MIKAYNPADMAAPVARYSHCVEAKPGARWLHVAGQVGIALDGTLKVGIAEQTAQCFANIEAALRSASMTKANLVKLTTFVTSSAGETVAAYRSGRDQWLADLPNPPAATYLVVAGLAHPDFLIEIEAIAAGE
jgi:2-iminobutanoate/2-iminopropanoate deaminase